MTRARGLMLAALCAITATACTKKKASPTKSTASMADSADQVIFKLNTIMTDRGVQRAELLADSAFFFDDNTRAELRGVTTTFFTKEGARNGVLTSRRGTYNMRANVMEARDNVLIVGVDGRRLTSPMVRFEQYRNLILSDSAFVFVDGVQRLEGVGFESDPQMLSIKIRQLSRGRGGSIVLPTNRSSETVIRSGEAITAPPSAGTPPTAAPPATTVPPAKPPVPPPGSP
jgi:LPS export ABC transporter protein LptC